MDTPKSNNPLTPLRTNLPQTPKQHKKQKDDRLLHAVEEHITSNKACDLLAIILADPHLKQLNSSLEKEAQEQKKSKLLESFPLRYNTLVQTEALYRQLQLQLKQQKREQAQLVEKNSNEIATLRHIIQQLESQLQKKQQQMQSIESKHVQQLQQAETQRRKDIDNKNKQLLIKDSICNELEKKYMKLKSQKKHTTEYIDQLKEECQVLRTQNDRIVVNLTQKQLQIQQLQQTIQKNKQQHQAEMQTLMDQITHIENTFSTRFAHKNQEYSELEQTINATHQELEICQAELLRTQQQNHQLQQQIQQINQQRDEERRLAEKEVNQLKHSLHHIEQHTVAIGLQYQQKISKLQTEKHQQHIHTQLLNSKQQEELANLQKTVNQMLTNSHTLEGLSQTKVKQLQQNTLELQSTISQLVQQKQSLAQKLQTANTLNSQIEAQLKQVHAKAQKQQTKNKDIERMVAELKKQMQNYDSIFKQKEEKIQSYRKEILCLRRESKQMAITTQQVLANSQNTEQQIIELIEQKQILELQLKQTIFQLHSIEELLSTAPKKQLTSIATETQNLHSEQILDDIDQLKRQLEKAQSKYLNVIEQLNQHKRQFSQQITHKDILITQIQTQNNTLRSALNAKLDDNTHIESVIDLKIKQLKQFYEEKIQQEGSRYRKIIQTLKTEMNELYNDIDLKKSIEDEMFKEIMKINSQRRCRTIVQ